MLTSSLGRVLFFFSSRRRHTRYIGDWSSDVCSSDLIGHDTHRLVDGRLLILGGVVIPFEQGLAGHSDADVVLHCVADALLGAAALGDIRSEERRVGKEGRARGCR